MSRVIDADTRALRTSAAAARTSRPAASQRESLVSRSVAMLIMVVFTLYFLIPIWWLLVALHARSRGDLFTTNPLWFADFNFWRQPGRAAHLPTTASTCAGSSTASATPASARWSATMLAGMCGYALAKYRFRGREVLLQRRPRRRARAGDGAGAAAVPAVQPGAADQHVLGGVPARASSARSASTSPASSPRRSVPDELLEAARIDGAGEVRTFFTVSIRLMLPALVTIFLFQFVAHLEQLLPAADHAAQRGAVPGHLGLYAWNSQINQFPELRSFVLDRRAPVDHPPDRRPSSFFSGSGAPASAPAR